MDSDAYWAERAAQRERRWFKKSQETVERQLAAYYETALQKIEDDIATLYGRYARENALSMLEARRLIAGREYRIWRKSLEDYVAKIRLTEDKGLLLELNTLAMRTRITRLEKLRGTTLLTLDRLGRYSEAAMDAFFSENYKDNYYHGLFDIGKEEGFVKSAAALQDKQIERVLRTPWSGQNYSARIWNNTRKLGRALSDTVKAGIHRGIGIERMAKMVDERMHAGRSNAVRLVRTEMNYVQNQAALDAIQDAGLGYYRFIATLDRRTSAVCREHDGRIYPIDEAEAGGNIPPLHPRCRSTIAAARGEKEKRTGSRAAREDGKQGYTRVPAEMQYADWQSVYIEKKVSLEAWKKENIVASSALSSPPAHDTIKIEKALRSHTTKLSSTMEKKDYDAYIDLLKNNERIAPLYTKYGDGIGDIHYKPDAGSYYPADKSIKWSYPREGSIKNGVSKFSTLAHEYGHHFDCCLPLGKLAFTEVKAMQAEGIFFIQPMASTSDHFLSAMRADKAYCKKMITKKVLEDFKSHDGSAGVQDALDGFFALFEKGAVNWGHGNAYYNREYNYAKTLKLEKQLKNIYKAMGFDASNQSKVKSLCRIYGTAREAWANILSAVTCGGEELAYTKQYMPNSYRALLEILGGLT